MFYDQPNIEEIELLNNFCRNNKYVYVYGCQENQLLLAKYLKFCDINIKGFVISNKLHFEYKRMGIPVYDINELAYVIENKEDIALIMALPGIYYNEVLVNLQKIGIKNLFFMSEHNKITIAYKMKPRIIEQFWLEVNIADHCNLNCQMCDHFSPIVRKSFLNLESYKNDLKRIKELCGNADIGAIKFQGGEPLLNNDINKVIKITRHYFKTTKITLLTNGILLPKWENSDYGNLWKTCSEYNIDIAITVYPIKIDIDEMHKKAKEYKINLYSFSNLADRAFKGKKFSVKHPFDLEGKIEKYHFINCYQFNESIVLRNGKIYTCPMIAYIDYFNNYFNKNLSVTENDYIDIYKAKNFNEIAEFVAKKPDFCKYCDVKNRKNFEWKVSNKDISEWT